MDYEALASELGLQSAVVETAIETAKRSMVPETRRITVTENTSRTTLKVTREGVGPLNTTFGFFQHFSFRIDDKWSKYSALVMAPLTDDFRPIFKNPDELVVRIDSGCETGQLFGDQTCECRGQLELTLEAIREAGEGMLINVPRQDGRGLGLPFKLATLYLQAALNVDTVAASAMLDPDGERDTRTYAGIVAILKFFDIPATAQIILASNNPKKGGVFVENGWQEPIFKPIVVPATEHTKRHLAAKQREFGHTNLVPETEE